MNGLKIRQFYLMVFCVIIVGLAIGVGFFTAGYEKQTTTMVMMREKSYFELMDGVENMTSNLNKIEVSESSTQQFSLLRDAQTSAEIASLNLAQLSSENQETENLVNFLNKVGDYTKALARRLQAGGTLSASEKAKITELNKICEQIYDEFNKGIDQVYLARLPEGINISELATKFNESTIDYPELIYDGPFSDALSDMESKFLDGKAEITGAEGEDILKNLLKDYELSQVKFVEEGGSDIETFTYDITLDGTDGTAQLTKKGGVLILLSCTPELNESESGEEELEACAVDFARAVGFGDLEVVWKEDLEGIEYFNLVPIESGVIYYPDLVMIKVRKDTCKVVGIESKNYILNHTERSNITFSLSEGGALSKVSSKITPISVKRALIPTDWGVEITSYEIRGHFDGKEYFIYLDAKSGDEIKVLQVVGQRMI